MSHLYQDKILSFDEASKRLNDHLNGLEITNVQNGMSRTNFVYLTIFSKKHNSSYSLSLGTNKWVWRDDNDKEISVFIPEPDDDDGILALTSEIENILENKLIIKKVKLDKKSMFFSIYFENGFVLEAQEDLTGEFESYYQLMLYGSKLYQNYNLLIKEGSCHEEIVSGEEHGKYKTAMFDLDYFRTEHRMFTNHAIQQARLKKAPVSFVQAKVLYSSLTTKDYFLFIPWRLCRSTGTRTRLDTIPNEELIAITREECEKNNFTVEEAKDILKATVDPLKEWLRIEKNVESIADQEYANRGIFKGLIKWYEEIV